MADITKIAANGIDYNIKDATARTDIATANTNISSLADDVDTAEGNISTLQGQMTTANGKITTLEGKMETAEGNISALQTAVNGMFAQHYESVAAGSTIYLTVPNYETGFIVTIGAYADARGIIIYYCNGQKTVSVTKAAGADGVQTIMSDNQLALKNNTSAALYVMQFKR